MSTPASLPVSCHPADQSRSRRTCSASQTRTAQKRSEAMLVLSRKPGERILVGNDVKITVIRIGPNSVRIGIDAPGHLNIVREELCLNDKHAALAGSAENEEPGGPILPR